MRRFVGNFPNDRDSSISQRDARHSLLSREDHHQAVEQTSTMKPDVAFYYPGQYLYDLDWIKNIVCFFDGVAMLIPGYMADHHTLDDYSIISALKDHGLFHVIRPEKMIDEAATEQLATAFVEIVSSGRLDHLSAPSQKESLQSSFGSLSMSRMGYNGDPELANLIFQELKSRGLAEDSEDGVSVPMHRTVRALILVLLAQIIRPKGENMGLTLSPATDRWRLVDALQEIISSRDDSSESIADVISFDMAMVGVNLGSIPMDEILDFRRQHYAQHRKYVLSVRRFAHELSLMPAEERSHAFEERQEELDDAARALRRMNRVAWKRAISFGISLAGAAWTLHSGDPIAAAIAGAGAAYGVVTGEGSRSMSNEVGVYSYIMSAKDLSY